MDLRSTVPLGDLAKARELEARYLSSDDPLRQSGWNGTPEKWDRHRKIQLEAVDKGGTFLDVGCANGYLLECLVGWASEQGVRLTPYGVDIGPGLVALAKQRLPQWRDNFFVGNIVRLVPPRRFDSVSTGLAGTDAPSRAIMLEWFMTEVVEPGGRLIVRCYWNPSSSGPFAGQYVDNVALLRSLGVAVAGSAMSDPPGAEFVWVDC